MTSKTPNLKQSMLCIGLDADMSKLPERFYSEQFPQFEFNKWIIDETHQYASAYKPNLAFYEAQGIQGMNELRLTIEYLEEKYPEKFTIADAKRGDIGNTNAGYVRSVFDVLGFDAVTLNPYLGGEALQPFLERDDKTCIVLCKTSNPGSGEFQDLLVGKKQQPLWEVVAQRVADDWNRHKNCMLVVGATYPEQLKTVRSLVGDMTILVPGVGEQGGDAKKALEAGLTKKGVGLLINVGRSIIFAKDPAAEAKKYYSQLTLET
jgi:orotidine-5'-phosphate decarboxylase